MVEAVALGRTRGAVDLRFALRQHPAPGEPTELDVSLVPSAGLDRVTATFAAEDGLELRDGGGMIPWDRPEPGVPIGHKLTVVPKRAGIFYVRVTVLAETATDPSARVFTIPVIAGGGVTADEDTRPATAPVAKAGDTDSPRSR